jgi:hypothetical protein
MENLKIINRQREGVCVREKDMEELAVSYG